MESIKIAGAGCVTSGIYDEVKLAGAVEVKGKVQCNIFKCSGSTQAKDTIECGVFKSSGTFKSEGSLIANEIRMSGANKINGKLEAGEAKISGSIIVDGDVNVDNLECQITNGAFANIYGDSIRINSDGSFLNKTICDVIKNIQVEEIEATSICIKDVKVNRVSGEHIYIEAGCHVKIVEYSKTLDISSKAKIDRIIKI